MQDESREWIERASRGDAQAVETLLERHLPDLENYVRAQVGALVGRKESASDLVQSACREVLLHMERFQYDGEEGFKRWLYATALRKIQDRHRYYTAQKRDAQRERAPTDRDASALSAERLLDALRSGTSPSSAAGMHEEVARLERALADLPERYGEVIQLAYLEGLPRSEIALRLKLSDANTRMLLSRALARLARLLET
jgi:RNA polymerase sigma-70 factor (ECF subfamily)